MPLNKKLNGMRINILFWAPVIIIGFTLQSCKKDSDPLPPPPTPPLSPVEEALNLMLNQKWQNSNADFHSEAAPYCSISFYDDNTYVLRPNGVCEAIYESGYWTVSEGANLERPETYLKPKEEVIMTFHLKRTFPVLPAEFDSGACLQGVGAMNIYWEVTKCNSDSLEIYPYFYVSAPCSFGVPEKPLLYHL
jgi:hypothetical protein